MPALPEAEQALRDMMQALPSPLCATVTDLKAEAFNAWSPGQTWFAWCSTTSTTVTMNDQAWAAWNNSVSSTTGSLAYSYSANMAMVSNGTTWLTWNSAYQETQDQKAERERMEAEAVARMEEQQELRAAAGERALELLRSLLSDAQWASYQEKGWFEVRGSSGRRWRVRSRGQSGNVDLMPEAGEERDATYCAHPPGQLPDADAHVAQMLALVTDDEAFERTANRRYLRPGRSADRAPQERVYVGTADLFPAAA